MRVATRAGPVDPARRQRAAPDRDVLVGLLGGVVRLRQKREVGRRGRVVPRLVELRQPEAVQVRLVADDDVADLGDALARSRPTYDANCVRASGVSGVVAEPGW